jgi:phenol 2-monooxygenase (NADPH)
LYFSVTLCSYITTRSRVFVDDLDVTGTQGGKVYATFGVEPSGAVVIVRPDGYVGMVAPFDKVEDLDAYFASFWVPL